MWTKSVSSRVCLVSEPERDKFGYKIRILIAEPRVNPRGQTTGNEDTLWLFIHLPEDYSSQQLENFDQARRLKKGDWFRWAGNLHTSYSKEKGSFAYLSVKDIETPYQSESAKLADKLDCPQSNPLLESDDWVV